MSKTLSELRESLQTWLTIDQEDGDERLPDLIATDIINYVSKDYLRRRESRLGEYSVAFNAVANTPDYDTPAGFSKPRKVWYIAPTSGQVTVLTYMDKDAFDVKYPYSSLFSIDGAAALILEGGGQLVLEGGGTLDLTGFPSITGALGNPDNYTIWRNKIILGKCPDASLIMFIDYYRTLPDLEDDDDHDRFTDEAWEYLLFQGLVQAAAFGYEVESERLAFFEKQAAKFEMSLDLEDNRMHTVGRQSQSREPG